MIGKVLHRAMSTALPMTRSRYLSAIAIALAMIAVAYFSWSIYRHSTASRAALGDRAVQRPNPADAAQLEKQSLGLKSELAVLERQLQIERASYNDLAKQLKSLSDENARLREDIALMQTIAGTDTRMEGIKLSSIRVEPVGGAGEYAYRMVLIQTGARLKPFRGSYQLVISMVQDGARRGLMLPSQTAAGERPYQLDFRLHQRIEGTFKVAPNAVVRSIQVRIFEAGTAQPKLMQTITLS